jgi:hypothetical protein
VVWKFAGRLVLTSESNVPDAHCEVVSKLRFSSPELLRIAVAPLARWRADLRGRRGQDHQCQTHAKDCTESNVVIVLAEQYSDITSIASAR